MVERHGIGLIGWGTVGGGVMDILRQDAELLQARCGIDFALDAIVTRTPSRDRGQDGLGAQIGSDIGLIVDNPDIKTVLHLVGGTEAARELALACLKAGKSVVTANKALVAEHGQELFMTAHENGVSIAFEAAVAGGIPVIAALRDGLVANRIQSMQGILNGTCNYILTKMEVEGSSYATALAQAQELGYAEADPTLDVNGTDTAHKLAILARIAFGGVVDFEALSIEGIENISAADIASARRVGCRIKLLGVAVRRDSGALELRVAPTLVPLKHPLADVKDNYNAVRFEANAAGPTLLVGQGAGALPTASAVVADLVDIATGAYKHTSDRFSFFSSEEASDILPENEEITGSYARLLVKDEVGVLATICTELSKAGISIASIHQSDPDHSGSAVIETLTHPCRGGDFFTALGAIEASGIMTGEPKLLRRLG